MKKDCIFCKIINREISTHLIYEDNDFIVILDKFPNKINRGQSLIIPKEHVSSYFATAEHKNTTYHYDDFYIKEGISIAKNMALLIDKALGSMRTCLVLEGMEIDHLHFKLYPIYKETYPHYLTTKKDNDNKGIEASDEELYNLKNEILN